MKRQGLIVVFGLAVQLIGCGGDARTILTPPAGGSGGMSGGGAPSTGGSGPAELDAGVDASDGSADTLAMGGAAGAGPGDASRDASDENDPGPPVPITFDPGSLQIYELPINSVRFAAVGMDAATGRCAAIIWDYSNNDLEVEPHCDDFLTYPDFPYVVLGEPGSCDNLQGLWTYAGIEPEFASGCFDPVAELVDVELEVSFNATLYRLVANNTP